MSEMIVPSVLFIIVTENSNISLHSNKKYIKNKVTWTDSTNDCQSPFIAMVKICHCHYRAIYLYSGQLVSFDEKYIILRLIPRYYSSRDSIMAQSAIMIETKSTPLPIYPFIECTISVISIPQSQYWCMCDAK